VYVFTDIDCGYCRKLHSEIDQYLAAGISVRYLFFPRAGKGSDSYNKAVSVWCAKDRAKALTLAKQDKEIEEKTCPNPIDKHMQLAQEFEVRGTPMIVSDKGAVFPGYIPAKQLAESLATPK
ncbi:MAG: DsbC family protein, partial [Methylococcaceae bacterium]|nr:DsbC family protein [Methylococcaceae bacterium]